MIHSTNAVGAFGNRRDVIAASPAENSTTSTDQKVQAIIGIAVLGAAAGGATVGTGACSTLTVLLGTAIAPIVPPLYFLTPLAASIVCPATGALFGAVFTRWLTNENNKPK